jgi:hypothetical protein
MIILSVLSLLSLYEHVIIVRRKNRVSKKNTRQKGERERETQCNVALPYHNPHIIMHNHQFRTKI